MEAVQKSRNIAATMGILDKLFKSRRRKLEDHGGLKDVTIDRKTGEINGTFNITVNGKEITIPIKTSVERLQRESERQKDPNSCEREPNTDEVKLPVDYDIRIVACDETETIINLQQTAMLRGYNNFVVPRDVLEHALAEYEKRHERDERMGRTAALNNKGIAAEKEGRIDDAIAAYEENIALGEKALHAYNRLRIIYKRLGRKDDERRVILRTMEIFGESEWLRERVKKLENKEN